MKICDSINSIYQLFNRQNFPFLSKRCDSQENSEYSAKIKKVTIKNYEGADIEAKIEETTPEPQYPQHKKFNIYLPGILLGYADTLQDIPNQQIYLAGLYTKKQNQNYKGAGTELLKSVVNESIKQGYEGRIGVFASNQKISPVGFYYKNNFITVGNNKTGNASIHYFLKNNLRINNDECDHKLKMQLDEKGAKALLEGKRLYKDRSFEIITQKIKDGIQYSAGLIQSPFPNEFFLLTAKNNKPVFILSMKEIQNENGRKHFVINDMEYRGADEDKIFAFEVMEKIAQLKGYDSTTVDKKLHLDKMSWYKQNDFKFPED